MTDTTQTSRWRILDSVSLIAEQIGLASHCQELINTYTHDLLNTLPEEIEEITNNIIIQKKILDQAIATRRQVMSEIFEAHQWDHYQRCSLKHAIASYGFSTECLYANPNNSNWVSIQQTCYENMIWVLWLFVWVEEFTVCSRCLEDELLAKKDLQITK